VNSETKVIFERKEKYYRAPLSFNNKNRLYPELNQVFYNNFIID